MYSFVKPSMTRFFTRGENTPVENQQHATPSAQKRMLLYYIGVPAHRSDIVLLSKRIRSESEGLESGKSKFLHTRFSECCMCNVIILRRNLKCRKKILPYTTFWRYA